MKLFAIFASITLMGVVCASPLRADGKIEADPSKDYTLTKSRGPWMIMVATFHSTDADGESDEGKTPEQAAHELVVELRKQRLPAYVHVYIPDQQHMVVTDRLGREERRKNQRRIKSVYVMAGNYNDINDKVAQDSLAWVKKYRPKCLEEGVEFKPTPGRPGPLSGAFLTVNPMLSMDEVEQQQRVDNLLVRLNHGERYSLLENQGSFTLVIARFYGKTVTVKPGAEIPGISQFLKDNDLDDAAEQARELVTVLRGNYDKETAFNNIEAYIWHDRHESLVTVGSFTSRDDPQIATWQKRFGPTLRDGVGMQPQHLALPGFGRKGNEGRIWVFNPEPEVMRVPRLR